MRNQTDMQEPSNTGNGGESFEAAWRERFAEFATACDDDAGIAGWSRTGLDARMRRFASLWQGGHRGEHWLDAGCGAGTYARFLLAGGAQVVGIDYSLPTLMKARERCPTTIGFAVSDVGRLPFAKASFHGVLCLGVIQALSESATALAELSTVVRPGGELWVDALNRGCIANAVRILWRRLRRRQVHLRYERPEALVDIMRANGFDEIKVLWMPIMPGRWRRIQHLVERRRFMGLLRRLPVLGLLLSHAFIVHGRKSRIAVPEAGAQ